MTRTVFMTVYGRSRASEAQPDAPNFGGQDENYTYRYGDETH